MHVLAKLPRNVCFFSVCILMQFSSVPYRMVNLRPTGSLRKADGTILLPPRVCSATLPVPLLFNAMATQIHVPCSGSSFPLRRRYRSLYYFVHLIVFRFCSQWTLTRQASLSTGTRPETSTPPNASHSRNPHALAQTTFCRTRQSVHSSCCPVLDWLTWGCS